MRISVELVPRSRDALLEELEQVKTHLSAVNTINIPDLLRFEVRSWEGCACAKRFYRHTVPHLRAIDIDLKKPLPMAEFLIQNGIDEVLVIAGDPPVDMKRKIYPSSSLEVIKKFKRELPHLKVYAALDPYRQSFVLERDYALQKLEAGADGIFSQPFFDVRLMEIYAELLEGVPMFWGVTSVTSAGSRNYWETRNKAIFPAHFEPTLAWNRQLAKEALEFARAANSNIYFMPIRTDVLKYLQGIV